MIKKFNFDAAVQDTLLTLESIIYVAINQKNGEKK